MNLDREYFPAMRLTRPPADAPSLADVVRTFVLLDVDLLVNAKGDET